MKELREFFTPDNIKYYIYADKDQDNFEEFVYNHGGVTPVGKLAYRLCGPDSIFFDVGANIGTVCIPVATKGTLVHAFEILTQNVEAIRLASAASKVSIHTHKKAVYDKNGVVNISGTSAWGQVVETGGQQIESTTLDSFCEINKIELVDVIKIDIEGSELQAFQGAEALLKRCRPDIIFESNVLCFGGRYSYQVLVSYLADLGYKVYRVYDNHLAPFQRNQTQTPICCDYFATFTRQDSLKTLTGIEVRPSTKQEIIQEILTQDCYTDIHRLYTYLVLANSPHEVLEDTQIKDLLNRWQVLESGKPELAKQLRLGANIV